MLVIKYLIVRLFHDCLIGNANRMVSMAHLGNYNMANIEYFKLSFFFYNVKLSI